jgi:ABC-type branched-subunit amino acid transport system ATPase component
VIRQLLVQPTNAKRPILAGINFSQEPGDVLVLLGSSGAGKTSLLRAMIGLNEVRAGEVRLDGADVATWIRQDLGNYVGYVPQSIDLFEGTVAENIARLGPVDDARVVAAAMSIKLHEQILALPQGYETPIGQAGHALTGGQRQRIAIARAMYGDPPFVVMDEPNSNLDEDGERALVSLVRELQKRGALVVFSSHRPMLVGTASHALVLKDGQTAAYGALRDVLARLKEGSAPAIPGHAVVSGN